MIALAFKMNGNPQDGRAVMVCSRTHPPSSRLVCDKEEDHFKLGTPPIEHDEFKRERKTQEESKPLSLRGGTT
jgi:hypothetical protein